MTLLIDSRGGGGGGGSLFPVQCLRPLALTVALYESNPTSPLSGHSFRHMLCNDRGEASIKDSCENARVYTLYAHL